MTAQECVDEVKAANDSRTYEADPGPWCVTLWPDGHWYGSCGEVNCCEDHGETFESFLEDNGHHKFKPQ